MVQCSGIIGAGFEDLGFRVDGLGFRAFLWLVVIAEHGSHEHIRRSHHSSSNSSRCRSSSSRRRRSGSIVMMMMMMVMMMMCAIKFRSLFSFCLLQ